MREVGDFSRVDSGLWSAVGDMAMLRGLIHLLIVIGLIGLVFSIIVFIATFVGEELYSKPFCLSSGCVSDFVEDYGAPLQILAGTLSFLTSIAAVGGILVALLTYITTNKTNVLTSHITHLSGFQQYVGNELKSAGVISPTSIDVFKFYNLIFPESKEGRMIVGSGYEESIEGLNAAMNYYENVATRPKRPYSYKQHQKMMQLEFAKIGFTIREAPKNDYYEVEEAMLDLIRKTNASFCQSRVLPAIVARKYQ